MLETVKRILIQLAIGANVMSAFLLWICGLTSYLNPADYPRLSLFCLGFPVLLLLNVAFVFFWLIFYARNVWIPIVGMLVSASFIYDYCPLNWPASPPSDAIKLITYNTELFGLSEKDEEGRYPVLDYLASSDADIICLQEGLVQKSLKITMVDSLMKASGYQIVRPGNVHEHRLLCYTRLPILSVERIAYESDANGSLAVRLLYEGDTILVVNNHLESYKLTVEDKRHYKEMIKDPERKTIETNSRSLMRKMAKANRLRGPQVDSVLHHVDLSGYESVIVCGDFNDSPISYSCHRLSSAFSSAFTQSGNGLGLSYNQKGFYFRIDHIFVSDYWQTYDTHVDKSIAMSDHYPLVTYLKKRKK